MKNVTPSNPYETKDLLDQYLLFHYGEKEDIFPYSFCPEEALNFHARCVSELMEGCTDESSSRALDIGCAVGRCSFELTRYVPYVLGLDMSSRFIDQAKVIKEKGACRVSCKVEGDICEEIEIVIPKDIDRGRVDFRVGDACCLSPGLGIFDRILLVNLIDRVKDPLSCLSQLKNFVSPKARVLVVSPYTWSEKFTPKSSWLGGFIQNEKPLRTSAAMDHIMGSHFIRIKTLNIPFLIREHARKFQLGISEAALWEFKGT